MFRMNDMSAGTWVPQAKMILISSVLGSMRLIRCLMKGDCFLVESLRITAGRQPSSLSKGLAPTGEAIASLKPSATDLLGRRQAWTYRRLSGVRSLLPVGSSKPEWLTLVGK